MKEAAYSLEAFRLQVHLYQKRVATAQIVNMRVKAAGNALCPVGKKVLSKVETLMTKRVIDFEEVFEALELVH